MTAADIVCGRRSTTRSRFCATATGFAPGALAIEVLGLQAINVPLSSVLPTAAPSCRRWQ